MAVSAELRRSVNVHFLKGLRKDEHKIVAGMYIPRFYDPWPQNPYTPIANLFIRENELRKETDPAEYFLTVKKGDKSVTMNLDQLKRLTEDPVEVPLVKQCAGDNRARLKGHWEGEAWGAEAYGAYLAKGTPFQAALDLVGMDGKFVIITGADGFKRRLTAEEANDPQLQLTWEINGEKEGIPAIHGGPVVLTAPGWMGMGHVKNVVEIEITDEKRDLTYVDHKYRVPIPDTDDWRPVRAMPVNSRIWACDGDKVRRGKQTMKGVAWVGYLPYEFDDEKHTLIDTVEVSLDGGKTWEKVTRYVSPKDIPNMWTRWEYDFDMDDVKTDKKGRFIVMSRAIDSRGRMQPEEGTPNPNGYENNEPVPVQLKRAASPARIIFQRFNKRCTL